MMHEKKNSVHYNDNSLVARIVNWVTLHETIPFERLYRTREKVKKLIQFKNMISKFLPSTRN